jgi:hypothetical protein
MVHGQRLFNVYGQHTGCMSMNDLGQLCPIDHLGR